MLFVLVSVFYFDTTSFDTSNFTKWCSQHQLTSIRSHVEYIQKFKQCIMVVILSIGLIIVKTYLSCLVITHIISKMSAFLISSSYVSKQYLNNPYLTFVSHMEI